MFSLLRSFLLTSSHSLFTLNLKSAFSFQRSFGGKSSWARFCTCCACVSFAWEIVRDSPIVNFVSQTMNKHIKTLVMGGKVYVAWKRKMLHDVIGGHQEFIFMKRFMAHRILQLAKTTRG